ncbi:MAG: hypothetical protein L3J66_02230 [Bacteroidales bacterium]|nr:hypothetical protein [Bacteroidales bacterium]
MKKLILSATIVFFSSAWLRAQTAEDVYKAETASWYGLDYTHAYFITTFDFPDPYDLKSKFRAWNELVLMESEKYNLDKFFNKEVIPNIDMINKRNDKIKLKGRITDDDFLSSHLDREKIREIVFSYNTEDDEPGIGLVFIVESLSKPNVKGAYWVTFFDIKSRKVITTERFLGKAGGFGLRNYWAKSYFNVMVEAGKEYQ